MVREAALIVRVENWSGKAYLRYNIVINNAKILGDSANWSGVFLRIVINDFLESRRGEEQSPSVWPLRCLHQNHHFLCRNLALS